MPKFLGLLLVFSLLVTSRLFAPYPTTYFEEQRNRTAREDYEQRERDYQETKERMGQGMADFIHRRNPVEGVKAAVAELIALERLQAADKDGDEHVTDEELVAVADKDGDGTLTDDEMESYFTSRVNQAAPEPNSSKASLERRLRKVEAENDLLEQRLIEARELIDQLQEEGVSSSARATISSEQTISNFGSQSYSNVSSEDWEDSVPQAKSAEEPAKAKSTSQTIPIAVKAALVTACVMAIWQRLREEGLFILFDKLVSSAFWVMVLMFITFLVLLVA